MFYKVCAFSYDQCQLEKMDKSDLINLYLNLQSKSGIDSLTGLYNRGAFDTRVIEEVQRIRRNNQFTLMLTFIDIDKFKQINDTHGHQTGDAIIRSFTQVLKNASREGTDLLYRLGGDEFVVLSIHTSELNARSAAERLSSLTADLRLTTQDGLNLKCSASQGFALLFGKQKYPDIAGDVDRLIKEADTMMYANKRAKEADTVSLNPRGLMQPVVLSRSLLQRIPRERVLVAAR